MRLLTWLQRHRVPTAPEPPAVQLTAGEVNELLSLLDNDTDRPLPPRPARPIVPAVRMPRRVECSHCASNIEAVRRYGGLRVTPVDGRDCLPHQALLACGHCGDTVFWVEPQLPTQGVGGDD